MIHLYIYIYIYIYLCIYVCYTYKRYIYSLRPGGPAPDGPGGIELYMKLNQYTKLNQMYNMHIHTYVLYTYIHIHIHIHIYV